MFSQENITAGHNNNKICKQKRKTTLINLMNFWV